ncbi:MAG: hypothetical protein JW915_24130 [Chitinispirillaceae bacterium]|nr:hypothetical protein [Chitinispirillaceae bacterium]
MDRFFSKLLQLSGEVNEGAVTFSDGTVYTHDEIVVLKKANETKEDIKKIHWVKAVFGGEFEFYGKAEPVKKKEETLNAVQISLFDNL